MLHIGYYSACARIVKLMPTASLWQLLDKAKAELSTHRYSPNGGTCTYKIQDIFRVVRKMCNVDVCFADFEQSHSCRNDRFQSLQWGWSCWTLFMTLRISVFNMTISLCSPFYVPTYISLLLNAIFSLPLSSPLFSLLFYFNPSCKYLLKTYNVKYDFL